MSNSEDRKRKFLKPIKIAVAALLSVTAPLASAMPDDGNNQMNTSSASTTQQSAKSIEKTTIDTAC
ncbi:MAG: hypothetical protein HWD59_09345 [Coxiellaceae bacterium]|nr:MAG: hypothetical protein HWD59_09345 [Coxiellaceae bacterium]